LSLLIKTGAGLCAGIFAGTLGYAFWPRIEPAVVSIRPAVEKPVFVVASAPPQTVPALLAATVAQPIAAAAGDKASSDKLVAASRLNPKAGPGSSSLQTTTVPGIADVAGKRPSEEAARYCAHGLIALADGDVAGARAFLERAAEAGDSRALMVLGDTYDAATLTRLGAVGIRGDAARAHDYYARALAAGVGAARERMAALNAQGD
jgi:TPR repeat protein